MTMAMAMASRKASLVRGGLSLLIILMAAIPAFSQRGTLGIDLGETIDQFGALPSTTSGAVGANAQFTLIRANKDGLPNIVVGAEVFAPVDTSTHAPELAVFGGPHFPIGKNFEAGFNVGIRKIYLPSSLVEGAFFDRYDLELLQAPIVLKYKFGPARRAFIQVQGEPEFTPHFKSSKVSLAGVVHPSFDYGYTVRGSVGYNFGKWYAKATCQSRYFKFIPNQFNPLGLYNWKSNSLTGGVGLNF